MTPCDPGGTHPMATKQADATDNGDGTSSQTFEGGVLSA